MNCPHVADSGVYVLGALAPAQRLEYERHLATCAECRAEVNDLAMLPGLLGRVENPVATVEPLPPSVLPATLRRIHRGRRTRRLLTLAAGFVLVALALTAGLVWPTSGGRAPTPPAWHEMQAVAAAAPSGTGEPDTSVTASVAVEPVVGGTKVLLKCHYTWPAGSEYQTPQVFMLFAYPRNGGPAQQLMAWTAKRGQDIASQGMTAWNPAQMSRMELRAPGGPTLLVYRLPA